MNDSLHDVLEAWKPGLPDVAQLRRGVWRRVDSEPSVVESWLLTLRPFTVGALLVAAVLLGAHLGERVSKESLERQYLASVNPYRHFQ